MRLTKRASWALLVASAYADLCNVPCFKGDLVARLRSKMPGDDQIEAARVTFAAVADSARLRILHEAKGEYR